MNQDGDYPQLSQAEFCTFLEENVYRVPFCVIITGTKATQHFYKLQLHVLGQETFHQLWLNPGLSDLSRNQE